MYFFKQCEQILLYLQVIKILIYVFVYIYIFIIKLFILKHFSHKIVSKLICEYVNSNILTFGLTINAH